MSEEKVASKASDAASASATVSAAQAAVVVSSNTPQTGTQNQSQDEKTLGHTSDDRGPACDQEMKHGSESVASNTTNIVVAAAAAAAGGARDEAKSSLLSQQTVVASEQQPPIDPDKNQPDPDEDEGDSDDDMTESGYEEDEDQEEDLDQMVAEQSPKGRFKRFQEELGRGAYKIVYKGVDHETGLEIAWNSISLNKLPQSDWARIKKEIDLIKSLKHGNIIHFITGWQNREKKEVVFITEITSGTLRRYIKKNKITKLRVIKGWCQSILAGLVYLHEQELPIIHRDLKCDNIFINSNSGEIRIGDLGLSTPMNNSYTSSVLGTPEFMAPELYEEHYDCKIDIYAFGMCMLEMITQELPYQECSTPAQIYKKVTAQQPPMALSRIKDSEVYSFIAQCLNPNKMQRPTARELLESDFITTLDDEKSKEAVPLGPPTRRPHMMNKRKSFLENVKSVIPEEEEETSDRDEPKQNKEVAAQQQQQPSQSQQPAATQQPQREECGQTLPAGKIESMIREMNAQEFQEEDKEESKPPQITKQHSAQTSQTQQTQQQSLLKLVAVNYSDRRESLLSTQTMGAPVMGQNISLPQLVQARSQHESIAAKINVKDGSSDSDWQRTNTAQTQDVVSIDQELNRLASEDHSPRQGTVFQVQDDEPSQKTDKSWQDLSAPQNTKHQSMQHESKNGTRSTQKSLAQEKTLNVATEKHVRSSSTNALSTHDGSNAYRDHTQNEPLSASSLHLTQRKQSLEPQEQVESNKLLMRDALDCINPAIIKSKIKPEELAMTQTSSHQANWVGSQVQQQQSSLGTTQPQLLSVQQTNSDGNQSQSSGMTMRKLTDVGNPDCTFSDPKFGQENALEDQSLVSSGRDTYPQQMITFVEQNPHQQARTWQLDEQKIDNYYYHNQLEVSPRAENHPFANLGATQDANEPPVGQRSRKDTQEAHFGGSGSDKQYTDEEDGEEGQNDAYAITDDDEESMHQKMNESVNFLNDFDKRKHSKNPASTAPSSQALPSQHPNPGSGQGGSGGGSGLTQAQLVAGVGGISAAIGAIGSKGRGNILDEFRESLEQQDERDRYVGSATNLAAQLNSVSHQSQVAEKKKQSQRGGASAPIVTGSGGKIGGSGTSQRKQTVKPSPRHGSSKQLIDFPFQQQANQSNTVATHTTQANVSNLQATPSQPVSVVKQQFTSDQKPKSTLVVGKKFEEDDIEKGGAQLLIDSHAKGSSVKPKSFIQNRPLILEHDTKQRTNEAIEQSQAQQLQQPAAQTVNQNRSGIKAKQSNATAKHSSAPIQIVQSRKQVELLDEHQANIINGQDESEYDEQRSSSDSDDSNLSEFEDNSQTYQGGNTMATNSLRSVHKATQGQQQQKPIHPSASQSQRHLVPQQKQLVQPKMAEHRHSISSAVRDQASQQNQQSAAATALPKQMKSSKSVIKSSKPVKEASLTLQTTPQQQQQQLQQSTPMPSQQQMLGDDWKVVTQGSRGQQQQQQVLSSQPQLLQASTEGGTHPTKSALQGQQVDGKPVKKSKEKVQSSTLGTQSRSPQHQHQQPKQARKVVDHTTPGAATQQQKAGSTTPNASDNETAIQHQSQQQQPQVPDNCVHSNWFRQSKDFINITIQYPELKDQKRHKTSKTSFDFNITQDTAAGVANEMVSVLSVNPGFRNQIKSAIDLSVRQYQHTNEQNKQKAEEKLLRHTFRKLQSHLDTFYAEMKQAGITNNKEICRVFDNLYSMGQAEEHAKVSCYFDGLQKINKTIKGATNHHAPKKTANAAATPDDHAHQASSQAAGQREQQAPSHTAKQSKSLLQSSAQTQNSHQTQQSQQLQPVASSSISTPQPTVYQLQQQQQHYTGSSSLAQQTRVYEESI